MVRKMIISSLKDTFEIQYQIISEELNQFPQQRVVMHDNLLHLAPRHSR